MTLDRHLQPGDTIYWTVPAGIGGWPTDGISVIDHIDRKQRTVHPRDGYLLCRHEIVELIAAANRPRKRRATRQTGASQ